MGATVSAYLVFFSPLVVVLLVAISIRLLASLRHLFFKGICALPNNWWETVVLTDCTIAPELLPGIGEAETDRKLSTWLRSKSFDLDVTLWNRTAQLTAALLLFAPAPLYRYSIKSTCWLYLPLVYLVSRPWDFSNAEDDGTSSNWRPMDEARGGSFRSRRSC